MNRDHCSAAVSTPAIAGWGTLLLVEGDIAARSCIQAMLEHLGYDLLTAHDGSEAVETFNACAHLIRLVITDIDRTRLNGWEVLAAIRRGRPKLPVVLASGDDAIPGVPP